MSSIVMREEAVEERGRGGKEAARRQEIADEPKLEPSTTKAEQTEKIKKRAGGKWEKGETERRTERLRGGTIPTA